jgi:hypothetical protein
MCGHRLAEGQEGRGVLGGSPEETIVRCNHAGIAASRLVDQRFIVGR